AATTAAAAPANASNSEQRAVLHARLVGDDGTPLPGATLRLVGLEHSGLTWQSPLQALLLPAATADGNGDAALVLRADARLFAEAPASLLPAPGECWRLR